MSSFCFEVRYDIETWSIDRVFSKDYSSEEYFYGKSIQKTMH